MTFKEVCDYCDRIISYRDNFHLTLINGNIISEIEITGDYEEEPNGIRFYDTNDEVVYYYNYDKNPNFREFMLEDRKLEFYDNISYYDWERKRVFC